MEQKITAKILNNWKSHFSALKYLRISSKLNHKFWQSSQYNTLLRYWELFWIWNSLLTTTEKNSQLSSWMTELLKLLNFKSFRAPTSIPNKELYSLIKNHCLHILLNILQEGERPLKASKMPFKGFILPQNNGKVISTALKRRRWYKSTKTVGSAEFIWTPIIKKGKFVSKIRPDQQTSLPKPHKTVSLPS